MLGFLAILALLFKDIPREVICFSPSAEELPRAFALVIFKSFNNPLRGC
jgi:hypothetical protein